MTGAPVTRVRFLRAKHMPYQHLPSVPRGAVVEVDAGFAKALRDVGTVEFVGDSEPLDAGVRAAQEQSRRAEDVRRKAETPMPRVRFLKDTMHPDHGHVKKGEVLLVDRAYVRDYEALGIAEETDDDVTERNAEA